MSAEPVHPGQPDPVPLAPATPGAAPRLLCQLRIRWQRPVRAGAGAQDISPAPSRTPGLISPATVRRSRYRATAIGLIESTFRPVVRRQEISRPRCLHCDRMGSPALSRTAASAATPIPPAPSSNQGSRWLPGSRKKDQPITCAVGGPGIPRVVPATCGRAVNERWITAAKCG